VDREMKLHLKMGVYWHLHLQLLVLLLVAFWWEGFSEENAAVYIVTMKQPPAVHQNRGLEGLDFKASRISKGDSSVLNMSNKPRYLGLSFAFLL
jgi:hypothetical protein